MNHILGLQAENRALKAALKQIEGELIDFSVFLRGAKFTTMEGQARADWIATGDVQRWISETRRKFDISC